LKIWFQEDLAQKKEELDPTCDEINKLKGSKKNTYKIRQMKKQERRQLKMVKLHLMKVQAPNIRRMIVGSL